MNKILSVHTCPEQCLYQHYRDGKCYLGENTLGCKEFRKQAKKAGMDLRIAKKEYQERAEQSVIYQYREGQKQKANDIRWAKDVMKKNQSLHLMNGGKINERSKPISERKRDDDLDGIRQEGKNSKTESNGNAVHKTRKDSKTVSRTRNNRVARRTNRATIKKD